MRHSLIFIYCCLAYAGFSQPSGKIIEYTEHAIVESGSLRQEVSLFIEISNKEGNWLGDIEIYYNEGDKYKLEEAELLDSKLNKLRKIKKKDVKTLNANNRGTFFDDRMVDKFSLKYNSYPYYIKYRYSITTRDFLYASHWVPRKYNTIPVAKASLTLTRPADYEIAIDSIGSFEYSRKQDIPDPNWITETWSVDYPKKVGHEPFSPPAMEELDQIQIVPIKFSYGVHGLQDSWAHFGEWISKLNEGLDELPPLETARLKTKFGHLTDTFALTESLYNYLQDNTRYINVSLDIGGLKSYPAEYVLNNQYGDCKALTMYMKALLKVFSIPSYYTIIEAGSNPQRIDTSFPSQQFNHVILCVPIGQDTIWLENTASFYPFNYLGTFTQNRTALLVNGPESRLIKTPPLTLEDVRVTNKFTLEITDPALSGTLEVTSRGDDFESLAYVSRFYNSRDQLDYVKSSMGKWNAQFLNHKISIPNRNINLGTLSTDVNFPQSLKKIGNKLILVNLPTQENRISSDDFKNRTRPIRFTEPVNITDSIEIDLSGIPDEYTAQPHENTQINFTHGEYHCTYEVSNKNALIVRVLKIAPNESPAAGQTTYYDFFESIENEEKRPLVFKKE